MKVSFSKERPSADLIVVPFWEGPKAAHGETLKLGAFEDFKGKMGEQTLLYLNGQKEPRALLLGLGQEDRATSESLRRAYALAVRFAAEKKLKAVNFLLAAREHEAIFEGILLADYSFSYSAAPTGLEKVCFVGKGAKETFAKAEKLVSGVKFARDLVNRNADDVTPKVLAQAALGLDERIETVVFDRKRLEKEGMGLILAVGRASPNEPVLIQAKYRGNPKSKEHIVLVGKGITYDTGGLKLKTAEGMMEMKSDMAGGAAVLGALQVAASLGLKVNVTALVPSAENCIGSKSYKLGDVYTSYSGKCIEINNTDAEGRLVLADAMSYAAKNLAPSCIVDLATLTGSVIMALGLDIAGLFSNNGALAEELLRSSESTGELLWRLPIHNEYKDTLKSDIADMLNSAGAEAGAMKAAIFLQEFVENVPWAHLDIAGPTYLKSPKYYNRAKGTGFGVRLLVDFLTKRAK